MPVLGQIKPRRPLETAARGFEFNDLRQPKGQWAGLAHHLGNQVPGTALEHQAKRFKFAVGYAAPTLVLHFDTVRAPHRVGHLAQEHRRFLRAVPIHRIDMQPAGDAIRMLARVRGQAGDHPPPGRGCHAVQAKLRCWARQTCQKQRVRLLLGEAGEIGAPTLAQLKAAVATAVSPDGHAGGGELIDIPQDRALGNLQRFSQRRCGHPPARLQQHHDRQQPARFHECPTTLNT